MQYYRGQFHRSSRISQGKIPRYCTQQGILLCQGSLKKGWVYPVQEAENYLLVWQTCADQQYQHLEPCAMCTRRITKQCPNQTGFLSHISLHERMQHANCKDSSNSRKDQGLRKEHEGLSKRQAIGQRRSCNIMTSTVILTQWSHIVHLLCLLSVPQNLPLPCHH